MQISNPLLRAFLSIRVLIQKDHKIQRHDNKNNNKTVIDSVEIGMCSLKIEGNTIGLQAFLS